MMLRRTIHHFHSQSLQRNATKANIYYRNIRHQNSCFTAKHFHHQRRRISITFLTDVEGDGSYFDRYVNNSKILAFQSRKPCFDRTDDLETKWNLGQRDEQYFPYDREVVFLEDDGMLVYGGDVWDKGGSDLYVIRQLLSLGRRYPNRVHFLMGNRDINKLRIVDELGVWSNCTNDNLLPWHRGVYWLRGTNMIGDPDLPDSNVPSKTRAETLKWMLQKTMGSPDAFELRRKELVRERTAIMNATCAFPSDSHMDVASGDETEVTDDEVVDSYLLSCDPNGGIMSQYLTRAMVMLNFGQALFMHGALPFSPHKKILHFPTPWLKEDENHPIDGCEDFFGWMNGLNQFAADQIAAWKEYGNAVKGRDFLQNDGVWATAGGYTNSTHGGKAFGQLLQYGMNTLPDQSKNLSVVYSSWMDDGMPRKDATHPGWSDHFKNHGLEVIATGHQPVGDMPWPIQICDPLIKSSWILPCDTSFSGDTIWVNEDDERANHGRGKSPSGRGDIAVCETLIQICTATNTIESTCLHGRLSDGSRYEVDLMDAKDAIGLGRPYNVRPLKFTDQANSKTCEAIFWSKVKVDKQYLASYGKGFNVWNTLITSLG